MSNYSRLKRLTRAWIGSMRKRRRPNAYEQDDPRMIFTELGLQMSPETLSTLSDNSYYREDFLVQLHSAEEELNLDLVLDNTSIDPVWDPKVYEENGKVMITATVDGEETIVAEFNLNEAP